MKRSLYVDTIKKRIAYEKEHGFGFLHFPFYTSIPPQGSVPEPSKIKDHIVTSLKNEGYYVSEWREVTYPTTTGQGRLEEIFIGWEDSEVKAAKANGYDFS